MTYCKTWLLEDVFSCSNAGTGRANETQRERSTKFDYYLIEMRCTVGEKFFKSVQRWAAYTLLSPAVLLSVGQDKNALYSYMRIVYKASWLRLLHPHRAQLRTAAIRQKDSLEHKSNQFITIELKAYPGRRGARPVRLPGPGPPRASSPVVVPHALNNNNSKSKRGVVNQGQAQLAIMIPQTRNCSSY